MKLSCVDSKSKFVTITGASRGVESPRPRRAGLVGAWDRAADEPPREQDPEPPLGSDDLAFALAHLLCETLSRFGDMFPHQALRPLAVALLDGVNDLSMLQGAAATLIAFR